MFDKITPEMMTITNAALVALALLTLLMVLMNIISVSRIKRRLLGIRKTIHEMYEQHEALRQTDEMLSYKVTKLLTAVDEIESIQLQLDEFDRKIAENQRQLTEHMSKLNEHDNILTQVNQMISEDTGGFDHAIQQIHSCEEQVRTFQCTFEQIRDGILKALNAMPDKMSPRNTLSPEQKGFKEEAVISTEPKKNDLEELYKSRMQYHYP